MNIAVVGAGGAGLACCWLLEDEHKVTLFERETRLGGHIHTVDVQTASGRASIDAGFEFFWEQRYPTFLGLLRLLGVPLRRFPTRVSVYRPGGPATVVPPLDHGRPEWSAWRVRNLVSMASLGSATLAGRPVVASRDPKLTVGEFLDGLRVPASVRDELLFPLLMSGWCVEPEEFRTFLASDVLSYFPVLDPRKGLHPIHIEVEGGGRTYVEAMRGALRRTTIRAGAAVERVSSDGPRLTVHTADGETPGFDAVVMATNANEAAEALAGVEAARDAVAQLRRVVYSDTRIALHGDPRLMPADRRHWSTVNVRYDGRYAHNTMWKPWRGDAMVFKSWVTHLPTLPEPLYSLVTYRHPWVNAAYFDVQRRIEPLQGRGGVWLAGMYANGLDNHEGTVCSAVRVALSLSPGSARLAALGAG